MMGRFIWLIALLLRISNCLEVAPNSPCGKKCIDDPVKGNPAWSNASLTFGPDLPCLDKDYIGKDATKVGKKLADCQTCMQSSGWEDSESGERDTTWYMFNLRGTVDYCIFGRFAEESNNNISATEPYKQCFSACNPIYAASDYRVKSDPERYDYCDSNGNYTSDAQNCMKCLYDAKGLTILGNVVATLTQLCNTKPGKNIDFNEDVYNATRIKLPEAAPTASSSSKPSSEPSSSPSSTDSSNKSDSGLSKAAIAGIVLGGLVAVAAFLAGILILLRRARKQRESKIVDMSSGGGASGAASIHNSSYEYTPVVDHKYMHQAGQVGELHSMPTAELGAVSPNGAAELAASSPVRGH